MRPHEESIAALLEVLEQHTCFTVTAHARPDGDAIGSVLALGELLEQLGRTVEIVLADPVPDAYAKLPNVERIQRKQAISLEGSAVIVLECSSIERTGLQGLEGRYLINIDHHASGRPFGNFNWIDADACAVAEMIYKIAVAAKAEITPSMATCLYAAVLSDTGSFTFPATTASTLDLAHALAERGASPSGIARDIFFTSPLSKVKLLGTALSNMECDGRIAWSWVTQAEMDRAGAVPEDCEGVVNHLIGILGVESAFFLRELVEPNQFRLSIRSKGQVDVARVAEILGGGGHRTASGCTMGGPLEVATGRILRELREEAKAGTRE